MKCFITLSSGTVIGGMYNIIDDIYYVQIGNSTVKKMSSKHFHENYSLTKELALIKHYKCTKSELLTKIESAKDLLTRHNKSLNELNKEYNYLIDLYPEEFI